MPFRARDNRGLLPTSFLDLSELDHHASFRREVAVLFVPGLMQTEHYARAVFSSRVPELTSEELELRVRHRMTRQEIAVPYEVVIHEAALRIRVSNRAGARAQLAHLAELSEADHITLRVIPFDMDDFSRFRSSAQRLSNALPQGGGCITRIRTVA